MSLAGNLAAWLAAAVAAGLLAGASLLVRNGEPGMPWQAPAILLGSPIVLAAACGLAAGSALRLASLPLRLPCLRRTDAHAATASFLAAAWVANGAGREFGVGGPLRIAGGLGLGLLAAFAAGKIARGPAARSLGLAFVGTGILGTGAFAAAFATLTRERATYAEGRDPRDFVPRFEPLPVEPLRQPASGRVVVLGLDGATWDRIDPLVAQGRLPHFARLKAEGATARLRTLTPTLSAPIWTSVATGKPPSVHGIRRHYLQQATFLRRPNLRMGAGLGPVRDLLESLRLLRVIPVTSSLRRCKAIWNIASEASLRVAVLGWWASWPVEPVNGWMVSDLASTARLKELVDHGRARNFDAHTLTHPPELLDEVLPLERSPESVTRADLGAFLPVDEEIWSEFQAREVFTERDPLTVFRATYLKDLFFAEVALKIDAERRPDLLLSYLKGIDVFGHVFWKFSAEEAVDEGEEAKLVARYRDCVDRTYEWTDRLLGRYLERLSPQDTIVVLSDHGWAREGWKRYGHHDAPDGILALLGSQVRAGARIEAATVLDVAPTLLHLLGLPKGEDMPGRVLLEALSSAIPVRSIPTWETSRHGRLDAIEAGDAEERERELRALGYVK